MERKILDYLADSHLPEDPQNSPNNSNNCYMFTAKQLDDIVTAKIAVSSAAVVLCLIGTIVIVVLKHYRLFVHRLVLYLMIVGVLQGLSTGMDVAFIHHSGKQVKIREGLSSLCVVAAFLFQVTAWQFLLVFGWITTYLVLLAVFKYRANSKRQEIAGLVISLGVPLIFNWLPFLHNMYGLAGPWCWIRSTNGDCHSNIEIGMVYQYTLFYAPQAVLILYGFVSFLVIVATILKRSLKQSREANRTQHSPYQQALKESLPLLLYPLLYNIITGVMIANRTYYDISTAHGGKPYFPLWFAHTIADPLRVLFVPVAFLLHPGTIRKLLGLGRLRFRRSDDSDTAYHVPQEPSFSEVEPLIIRSASKMSNKTSSDHRSIFESDDETI